MIIAIGGASRSGKTTLAKAIQAHINRGIKSCTILHQDDFVYPKPLIPSIDGKTNYECPESIDFETLRKAIYRAEKKFDIVIVEGFLIYCNDKLARSFDEQIFLEIARETFLERKKEDKLWPEPDPAYRAFIWESFLLYGQAPEDDEILFLSGEEEINLSQVLEELNL